MRVLDVQQFFNKTICIVWQHNNALVGRVVTQLEVPGYMMLGACVSFLWLLSSKLLRHARKVNVGGCEWIHVRVFLLITPNHHLRLSANPPAHSQSIANLFLFQRFYREELFYFLGCWCWLGWNGILKAKVTKQMSQCALNIAPWLTTDFRFLYLFK